MSIDTEGKKYILHKSGPITQPAHNSFYMARTAETMAGGVYASTL